MSSLKKLLVTALGLHRRTTITRVEAPASSFRRLTLSGEALRSASYAPGDKVQVMLADGVRTYSPFAFDAARGTLDLLVYLHGDASPGARWAARAEVGDEVLLFGPRGSLPLSVLTAAGPVVLFGDETSFGVAHALCEHAGDAARLVFEVSSRDEALAALGPLAARAELVARSAAGEHIQELCEPLRAALAEPTSQLVLTGHARSIQRVRAELPAKPGARPTQKVKAYWALGKTGLD